MPVVSAHWTDLHANSRQRDTTGPDWALAQAIWAGGRALIGVDSVSALGGLGAWLSERLATLVAGCLGAWYLAERKSG